MRRTCLDMIYELAKLDPRVVFIGSDLGVGTLENMKEEMPGRFFMEGVQEQHLIGMAAGLALEGYVPYVNTIATFISRRCFEQVAVDLCLHNLPVRLIGNGGGLVYAPLGPTHLAIEDLGILRTLPNMTIVAPTDANEMKRLMPETLNLPGPMYIRLGKGGDPIVSRDSDGFSVGKGIQLRKGADAVIFANGVMVKRGLEAAELLAADGFECTVMNLHTIKPLDTGVIVELARKIPVFISIEEHVLNGGLGSAIGEVIIDEFPERMAGFKRLGLPDSFPNRYGSQDSLLEYYGLQPEQIANTVREKFAKICT